MKRREQLRRGRRYCTSTHHLDPHAASIPAVLINVLLKKKIQESRPELCSNF